MAVDQDPHPDRGDVAAIVLAAGKGTRFRSDVAKVLHRTAGRSLVGHVLEALRPLGLGQVIVVVGHQREAVEAEVAARRRPRARSRSSRRTSAGPATRSRSRSRPSRDGIGRVLVLPGDTPLLTAPTLESLLDAADGGLPTVMLPPRC